MTSFRKQVALFALIIVTTSLIATTADAQWSVTRLAPQGSRESYALTVDGGRQGGFAIYGNGGPHAALWAGSASSFVNLSPSPVQDNWIVYGAAGTKQVGIATFQGETRASLWNGTPESRVDLHPRGAQSSAAYAIAGGVQVGFGAFNNGRSHAGMWRGSASSWVDLHPTGAYGSEAYATDGKQTAGMVIRNSFEYAHASLWNDSREWLDLNPANALGSAVYGTLNGIQVGHAAFSKGSHAGMWYGSANSWKDLNPAGVKNSVLYGLSGDWQVGVVSAGSDLLNPHAGIWSGSAETFEDLHKALPGDWLTSTAKSVWADDTTVWVAGWATARGSDYPEAIVWSRPVPEPAGLQLMGIAAISVVAYGLGRAKFGRRIHGRQ